MKLESNQPLNSLWSPNPWLTIWPGFTVQELHPKPAQPQQPALLHFLYLNSLTLFTGPSSKGEDSLLEALDSGLFILPSLLMGQ